MLGLNVAKRPWDGKFAWLYTERSKDSIAILAFNGALIDLSASLKDPFLLSIAIRFMVLGNSIYVSAHISTKNGPAVSYVGNVANFINNQQHNCATATALDGILWLCILQELLLCLPEAELESFDGFMWKVRIFCDLDEEWGTYRCIFSLRKSEHLLPPWPSNTPK